MDKKLILTSFLLGIFLLGSVSATYANFYYSESCPHCQKVLPLVNDLSKTYPINFYNVNEGSYNISGVPFIQIITSDCRKIDLIGSYEIPKFLKCELQEKSTIDCPTYSYLNTTTDSYFIR